MQYEENVLAQYLSVMFWLILSSLFIYCLTFSIELYIFLNYIYSFTLISFSSTNIFKLQDLVILYAGFVLYVCVCFSKFVWFLTVMLWNVLQTTEHMHCHGSIAWQLQLYIQQKMRAVKSTDYRVESGQSRFSAHATETSQEASSESSKDWHGRGIMG